MGGGNSELCTVQCSMHYCPIYFFNAKEGKVRKGAKKGMPHAKWSIV